MRIALLSILMACFAAQPSWSIEETAMIIDVRTPAEWAEGRLQSAHHLELNVFAQGIEAMAPDKDQPIYLYCRSGNRSGQARDYMVKIGYSNVVNAGGLEEAAKLLDEPIVK
jgi:phage shock protein E